MSKGRKKAARVTKTLPLCLWSFRFRGGILLVLERRRLAERNIADNREFKTFQRCYFGGMIRKK